MPKKKTTKKTSKKIKVPPKKKGDQRNHRAGPSYTEEMIFKCVDCMAQRMRNYDIRLVMEEMYERATGKSRINPAMFNRLLNDARTIIYALGHRDRDQTVAEAIAFYEDIIRDTSTNKFLKMRAQERLDAIGGHDAKYSGRQDDPDEISDRIRALLKKIDEVAQGE